MNDLVYLKNEEAMTDSLSVAEHFHKNHKDVIRKIENLLENDSAQNCARCFKASKYKDAKGEWRKKYLMNRDGFVFLVMGFTGKKANEWKWSYIHAFNSMEEIIRERNTDSWIETREYGKLTRKAETDMIQKLVEYAKGQGSKNSQMLYINYTKIANKMAGVTDRDEASTKQLNDLSLAENIILHIIDTGILAGKHYKEIFQDCKKRLEEVKDLAFLETH